ncbi:MAG: outer membrane lipoprotein-sorting protein [bacterium]
MKKTSLFLLATLLYLVAYSATIDEVMERVEKNMVRTKVTYLSTMKVSSEEGVRTMRMKMYVKDEANVLVEVIESSEGGKSRFLKKDDAMWLFIPSAGRSVLIKGHMLKEGFMGSNFSYEDISEARKIRDIYSIELEEDSLYYILTMTAKVDNAPYKMKKSYVTKDNYLPRREEIYSSSKRLLKEFEIEDYKEINGIYIPTKVLMRDLLQKNMSTEITYESIDMSTKIPDSYFTKVYLER